jgi:ATP-dependent Clp protease ATP-binding subunit ClpA
MGVRYVAPSHGTGCTVMQIFVQVLGDGYLHSGAGRIITAGDLV